MFLLSDSQELYEPMWETLPRSTNADVSFFSLSTILFWTLIAWSTSSADAILSFVIARNAAALPIADVSQFSIADVLFILEAALNSSARPDATWAPFIDISAFTTTLFRHGVKVQFLYLNLSLCFFLVLLLLVRLLRSLCHE